MIDLKKRQENNERAYYVADEVLRQIPKDQRITRQSLNELWKARTGVESDTSPVVMLYVARQQADLTKGMISGEDLAFNNALVPTTSSVVVDMMVDTSDFLSKIRTTYTDKVSEQGYDLDQIPRQLTQVPEGREPTDDERGGNPTQYQWKYDLKVANFFPAIPLSTLRQHAANPQLFTILESQFNKTIMNDFSDLALNGTADVYVPGNFLTLNRGFLSLASDAALSTIKKNYTIVPADGLRAYAELFKKIYMDMPQDFRANCALFCNELLLINYGVELGMHVTGTPLYTVAQQVFGFQQMKFIPVRHMPVNKILFTPPDNLWMVTHNIMKRSVAYHNTKRVLEYVFDFQTDFEIRTKQACLVGTITGLS